VNLAALAADGGSRVLLIDADPLGSVAASLQLARDAGDGPAARPDGVTGRGATWAGVLPNLDVVCPYPADDTSEAHLFEFLDRLPASPVARFYDRVVLDAPPMPGPRTKALLKAADEVVVVQRAEPMSFRTLPVYLELVREARQEGGACRLRGILLTLPPGVPVGGKAERRLRDQFKGLLPQAIPFDPDVNRALVFGKPVVVHNPAGPVAAQFRALAASIGLVRAAAAAAKERVPVGAAVPAAASPDLAFGPSVSVTDTPPPAGPTVKIRRPARVEPGFNPLALGAEDKYAPERAGPWGTVAVLVGCAAAVGGVLWYVLK
jgi:cellulose biosynthesis protein BcsQ